jgi:hypothetical protein
VFFAGAVSPSQAGASLAILRLSEITLIEALTSQQVIMEAECNLIAKLPQKLPEFRLLVSRCLHVVPDPSVEDLVRYAGMAHPKDLPIVVAAVRERCPWLVTFNVRHFQPGHVDVTVLQPGDFVFQVRDLLTRLAL